MIATKEFVNTLTGEIIDAPFLPYRKIRFIWKKAFLRHLRKQNIIKDEEFIRFTNIYQNGFHVYFRPVTGDSNDKLFRTAEYIATGYFHNSQIQEVNYEKRTITFKYRKMMERGSRKKHFSYKTMDIYEFMAKMLYFLPEKHRKMLRYYGIYAHNVEKKLDQIERNTWARAIEHSFNKEPEKCPECNQKMLHDTVFSSFADKEILRIMKTHRLEKGYFIQKQTKQQNIRSP